MRRSVGTRLGPYEITSLLGAGGMGEVGAELNVVLNWTACIKR
ncbi:MAG TPA: hypothetical protein VKF81_07265 [Blastocatellia bacterium]|nr:hypothetical protein [Blastocatellia bacterium]